MNECRAVLVDKRNYATILPTIIDQMSRAVVVGLDTETHNENAHAGIKEFNKSDEGKGFDWRRIKVAGFSIYPYIAAEEPVAYYINLDHKDVENRLTWKEARVILDARNQNASWICHKAPFEITVFMSDLKYRVENYICTLQMAVSAYSPDEYDHSKYLDANFGAIKGLFMSAQELFRDYTPGTSRDNLSIPQQELLNKVLAKTSWSETSYNGFVNTISYGYGLKKAIKSFFNVDMMTYEQVLASAGAENMSQLTGDQVVAYGADDAYWAVKLFFRLYTFMKENCPDAIPTFFAQENPMAQVFADIALDGMRINTPAVKTQQLKERANFAATLRKLKAQGRALLPFRPELDEKLAKYDKWYGGKEGKPGKGQYYRQRLEQWLVSPDSDDDYTQACQVSSPVSNAWKGDKNPGISIGHYFQSRLLMYDLIQMPAIVYKGAVSSDAECRGELREKIKAKIAAEDNVEHWKKADALLALMGEVASIEQRMKLYLTPYLLLTDPETNCMYPEVSSMLATRRMSCSNPNAQQLTKRGESTYIRGFFLADNDDEVIVSIDWSQIELVLIGEFSGDPEFFKAYGQLPYEDLHLGTAADVLAVNIEGVTYDMMKNLHKMDKQDIPPALLIKPNGEPLNPKEAKKYWRTEVGKGSNFNYWFSGALNTVGERLGWTSDIMWAATDAYRKRFAVAEKWRTDLIAQAQWDGFVQLPDGHKRTRWEATHEWANITRRMFEAYGNSGQEGVLRFGELIMKATRSRANNQLINAKIQGSCATLAKRAIININAKLKELSTLRARFKMAIHDEVLYSVHRDDVVKFIHLAKDIMRVSDIIVNLKIDATVSVGRTFEPWKEKNSRPNWCQIELDECPPILDLEEGSKLDDVQIQRVIDEYIFREAA